MSRAAPVERDFLTDTAAARLVALPSSVCSPQGHQACPLLLREDLTRFRRHQNALIDCSLTERVCVGASDLEVGWVEDFRGNRRRELLGQSIPIRLQPSKSRFMTIDNLTKVDALPVAYLQQVEPRRSMLQRLPNALDRVSG